MGTGHGAAFALVCGALLAFSASASAAGGCTQAGAIPSGLDNAAAVSETVCDINAQREAYGLAPLRWNARLGVAAARMAADMRAHKYFGHVSWSGQDLWDRIAATGYLHASTRWALGENIAWGERELGTPVSIANAWLESPAHRRNVLSSKFTDLGVGVVDGSPLAGNDSGSIYVADFGSVVRARQARHHRRLRR
jgi:uncharacterized protein YkwD